MQFKRVRDPFMTVLFENDDIVAIDKPYGISSHTNDSKVGNEGYIQQGLIELFEDQLGRKLHIVHRLDRTTTGVIVFAKSLEAASRFQTYFRERQTEKTYLFVTRLQVSATALSSKAPIIVKGSELEAETSFTRLTRSGSFDLWQARPRTGRNHQIRVHASGLGIPLLGDTLYGGAHYPFICLHNRSIRFPGDLFIESPAPAYFDHLEWLAEEWFAITLFEVDRRKRLFNENASSIRVAPGLDIFGPNFIANDGNSKSLARIGKTLNRDVIVHRKDHWMQVTASGEETPVAQVESIIEEHDAKYELRFGASASTGLSLEQRAQRLYLRENSRTRDVLNLFAANCTASVASALGDAKSVTSVEPKKSALEWGRKNFDLNGIASPKLLLRDPITFIQQSVAKETRFDLIVCEVPSFLRREKGLFKIENDLEPLLADCLKCLNAEGELLFSTTAATLKLGDLRSIIERAARSAKIARFEIALLLPTLDMALPDESHALKTLLVRKLT